VVPSRPVAPSMTIQIGRTGIGLVRESHVVAYKAFSCELHNVWRKPSRVASHEIRNIPRAATEATTKKHRSPRFRLAQAGKTWGICQFSVSETHRRAMTAGFAPLQPTLRLHSYREIGFDFGGQGLDGRFEPVRDSWGGLAGLAAPEAG
jgi:hypothetical protein